MNEEQYLLHFSIHNWRKFSETWMYSNRRFFVSGPNSFFRVERLNEDRDGFHSIFKVSNRLRLEQIWQMVGKCLSFGTLGCSMWTSFNEGNSPSWSMISTASSSAKWSNCRTISSSREANRPLVPFWLMRGMILSNIRVSMSNDRRCGIHSNQFIVESISSSPVNIKETKSIAFSLWLNNECWCHRELFILR